MCDISANFRGQRGVSLCSWVAVQVVLEAGRVVFGDDSFLCRRHGRVVLLLWGFLGLLPLCFSRLLLSVVVVVVVVVVFS